MQKRETIGCKNYMNNIFSHTDLREISMFGQALENFYEVAAQGKSFDG